MAGKLSAFPGGKITGRRIDNTDGGDNSGGMEARVARLESDVEHVKKDVADIKLDIREMRQEIGSLRKELHSAKIWALILGGSAYASMLGVMAKGFGWIK